MNARYLKKIRFQPGMFLSCNVMFKIADDHRAWDNSRGELLVSKHHVKYVYPSKVLVIAVTTQGHGWWGRKAFVLCNTDVFGWTCFRELIASLTRSQLQELMS